MRSLALAALIVTLLSSAGCRRQQTSNADTTTTDTTITATAPAPAPETAAPREFTFDQRQQFAADVRQQLATIDGQIQELAAQAKSQGGAVSDRALAGIRNARKAVDRSLARVNAATAANWEQVKSDVNRSVERLNESIEGAQPK